MSANRIHVPVPGAAYDIVLGESLTHTIPGLLAEACPASEYVIIADETVAGEYAHTLKGALPKTVPTRTITFPPGEKSKTREEWIRITDIMMRHKVDRDAAVIALGGGVTGDLAGFVAATFRRGVPLVQIPTTLLAMIDSSIGGKTGVDTVHGKNLVGAFLQPRLVVADVAYLRSLPRPHLAAGAAEAVKHGVIADPAYFGRLVDTARQILDGNPEALLSTVKRSVELKAEVVAADERERGRRAVLNFGHTIGHAIESCSGFEFLHGQAVAMGMAAEAKLAVQMRVAEPGTGEKIRAALAAFGLPVDLPNVRVPDLMEAMAQDKKNRNGEIHVSLPERVGAMARTNAGNWTFPVSCNVMEQFLKGVM